MKTRASIRRFKACLIPVTVSLLALGACDRTPPIQYCPAPQIVNGSMELKTTPKALTLKLPANTNIGSSRFVDHGCDHFNLATMDYLWYQGRLIPEGQNRFKIPSDQHIAVNIYLNGSGRALEEVSKEVQGKNSDWRFTPAIPHTAYPLEFYPRAFWDVPEHPPDTPPKDHLWGVRGTRNPVTGRPFTTACAIHAPDNAIAEHSINAPFVKGGYNNCRGYVSVVKNGVVIEALIEVWSNGAPELDLIYNATSVLIESFVQPDNPK